MAKRPGDIRSFLRPIKRSARESDKEGGDKVVQEKIITTQVNHSHSFFLKFNHSEDTHTIHCNRPQTVLDAIKSKWIQLTKHNIIQQNITLQISDRPRGTAIPTHFPCCLLKEEELVTLRETTEEVEKRGKVDHPVSHDEQYYIVFIETKPGINAKTKRVFKSSSIKDFTRLCVYGTKGMTIRDAIASDGRFEELGDFKLEDVSKTRTYVFSDDKIEAREKKMFRIGFGRGKNIEQETQTPEQKTGEKSQTQTQTHTVTQTQGASVQPEQKILEKVKALVETEGKHLGDIMRKLEEEKKNEDVQSIYQLLRDQFPDLRKTMLERFPKKSFAETLKKVDFGKAQQSFSDVFRLRQLLEHGKSVCKLVVGAANEGTGFVLFENYILTNAHLFDGVVRDNIVDPNVIVTAVFNYVNPNVQSTHIFTAPNIIDIDRQQDYAVLEFQVPEQDEAKVPPGLMKFFSPMPESGEACIVGHPGGDVLKIDPTCIIKSDLRIKGVHEHLQQYKENLTALVSVIGQIKIRTFMYHGSSGSPVFDAHCRVFGLHSGGFTYELENQKDNNRLQTIKGNVVEFSWPKLRLGLVPGAVVCTSDVVQSEVVSYPLEVSVPPRKSEPKTSAHQTHQLMKCNRCRPTRGTSMEKCVVLNLFVGQLPRGRPGFNSRSGHNTTQSKIIPCSCPGDVMIFTTISIFPEVTRTEDVTAPDLSGDEKTMAEQQVTSEPKLRIKSEEGATEKCHSHKFKMKFHNSEKTHRIHCEHKQTVLEAIKFKMGSQFNDQNLTLMIIKNQMQTSIPTHFPCCLLKDRELVTLRETAEEVEKRGKVDHPVSHDEKYYTVFIETKPGINAKTKRVSKVPP
ncbi:hypothetical protein WMY93_007934 [Mugilogobius chulae]|uniref:Serine protease n=1 Tax=Mugilogobius chulae TaxID=88201 RepID=A0AAW0PEH7_9GOBI